MICVLFFLLIVVCLIGVWLIAAIFYIVVHEQTLNQVESVKSKSSAMGVIPFHFADDAKEQLVNFKDSNCNWLEMTVVTDTINLVSFQNISDFDHFAHLIHPEKARYSIKQLYALEEYKQH